LAAVVKFESRDAASAAAAARLAGLISAQLALHDAAHLVVSGGTTPGRCFGYLAGYDLAWDRVGVALSDERWVPATHEDSNERLVRMTLLVDKAAGAKLLSLYQDGLSVDERCNSLQQQQPQKGFAAALIGMGADGHFASLFPDADCLAAGLDPGSQRFYIPVRTAASPHPRISMTLQAIMQSTEIVLLFFGDEKLRVFEKAQSGDEQLPIAALLDQDTTPVSLYWAP